MVYLTCPIRYGLKCESMLTPGNDATGNFIPGVTGGLGMEIISSAVYDHRPADDIPHTKTICLHSQVCPSATQHQWGKVPGMVRMRGLRWIVMAVCIRKMISRAFPTLMNVQGKKTRIVLIGQSGYIGYYQDAVAFLIKLNFSRQTWRFRTALDISNRIWTGRTILHNITSHSSYAQGWTFVNLSSARMRAHLELARGNHCMVYS